MSKMFEVMKQTEIESDKAERIQARAESERLVANGVLLADRRDPYDEEISRLVQTIFRSGSPQTPSCLVFCGVEDAEGSTLVCASAGRALAARNDRVCVLDAQERGARLSRLFGVNDNDLLQRDAFPAPGRCIRVQSQLWVATPNMVRDESGSLIPATDLKLVLSRLQATYGTVLIDAPGTSSSRDAVFLAQLADAAVLVVEANSTRKLAARKAKECLQRAGVQLIGAILNNRTFPIPDALYKHL